MQKIGIYGGSFDPVHIGHIRIAETFIKALNLERLIVIPAANPPHKPGTTATGFHRYNMLKIACALLKDGDKIEISPIEINRRGKSYTCDTAIELRALYPNAELYLCMGLDMFVTLASWHNPQVIFDNTVICTVGRDGESHQQYVQYVIYSKKYTDSYNARTLYIPMKPIDISSGEIRESLAREEDVSDRLPLGIPEYIVENRLYR
jgi:nicotinate-nucleotide adenylyltransferase